MAVVPGVLLDHVHHHVAQHVAFFPDDIEVSRLGHKQGFAAAPSGAFAAIFWAY